MKRGDLRGYAAAAVGAAAYGLNPLFSLPMYAEGMTPVNVLFYRFFMAAVMVGGIYLLQGGKLMPQKGELPALLLGAILMTGSSISLFQAYLYMDSGIVSTLLFIYPVVVAAMMTLFFREKLTAGTCAGIILALLGVIVLAKSDSSRPFDWRGLLLSLASAFSYSFYIVAVKVTRLQRIDAEKISFYSMFIGALLFLLCFDCTHRFPMPQSALTWGCSILLALLPTVVAFVLTARAIHLVGATPTAIFGGLEPAVAVICGIAAFNEKFTFSIAAGVVLVIASVMTVIFSSSKAPCPEG